MNFALESRKLANYIISLGFTFNIGSYEKQERYNHIGALFTDVVLQAGVNYKTIVRPRVQRVLLNYAEAYTVFKFKAAIETEGLENIINWRDSVKIKRILLLLQYSLDRQINTCADLKAHLLKQKSREEILELNGFGPKTVDYLMNLLNIDSVAVDRHVYSFVKQAGIDVKGYIPTKRLVEYAADFLSISRSDLDTEIWKYMSQNVYQKKQDRLQLALEF